MLVPPREKAPGPKPVSVRRRRLSGWPGTLALVASRRGKWMLVGQYRNLRSATVSASAARRTHDPDGRFEFASREEDGQGVVYARLKTA